MEQEGPSELGVDFEPTPLLSPKAQKKSTRRNGFGGIAPAFLKEGGSASSPAPKGRGVDDRALRNHMNQTLIHRAPEPSRASRDVVRRSKASLRGSMIATLPAYERPRVIQFESMLEYRFLCLTLLRPDIHDILEQPPAILYRRADGSTARHVFDFLITLTNGERIAVAIKPAGRVIRRDFITELRHIAAAMPKHFAHRVRLVTDEQLNRRAAAEAARQIMRNRPALTEVAA